MASKFVLSKKLRLMRLVERLVVHLSVKPSSQHIGSKSTCGICALIYRDPDGMTSQLLLNLLKRVVRTLVQVLFVEQGLIWILIPRFSSMNELSLGVCNLYQGILLERRLSLNPFGLEFYDQEKS